MFIEQPTQQLGVLLVLGTADLSDTVEGAQCAGISLPSKHHHLVWVDLDRYVLFYM